MTGHLTLTAVEAQAFSASPIGETFWLVRANDDPRHPSNDLLRACAPCETCGDSQDRPVLMGGALHEVPSCDDCRIELVGPSDWCEACQFVPVRRCVLNKHSIMVGGAVVATRTLGHAYAEGQPLPIAWEDDFSLEWQVSHNPIVIVTERAPHLGPRLLAWHDPDAEPVGIDLTAAVAHCGPPETLVGQWAIALRRVA